jgi:hypothetical protein
MKTVRWIVAGAVAAALAGCGAEEIVSPGSGGNITITYPPAPPAPEPEPEPEPEGVQPAASCPSLGNGQNLDDHATITGPTGTYRVCALPARVTASATLVRLPGVLYSLPGRVDVGSDLGPDPAAPAPGTPVTLTINPGVVVFAETGTSWLAVNRGNKLTAIGTATKPIVFTSRENVLGQSTDTSHGQWGGVVLMGRAPITDCRLAGQTPGTTCERQTEGSVDPAFFGGAVAADNSGTIDYVQIRYSGYILGDGIELQALTLEGTGSATKVDHFQSFNSSDDGIEIFGGRTSPRRMVLIGADDDTLDVDVGYQGTIQYVLGVQKTAGAADSVIELDTAGSNTTTDENQQPRTKLKLANFTFIHANPANGNAAAVLMRGKADASLVNGIVTSQTACLRLVNTAGGSIIAADAGVGKDGPPVFRSVNFQCGATQFVGSGVPAFPLTAGDVATTFGSGTNNNNSAYVASFTGGFVPGATEAALVATDPKTIDTGFDTTTFVGALRASDTWHQGWTCNSATANFGASSTACTTLPSLED